MSDLTTKILVEIRDEIKTIGLEHGERLDTMDRRLEQQGKTLTQHSITLEQHSKTLAQHSRTLTQHGNANEDLGQTMERQGSANGLVLKQILRAVEYGNKQRDLNVGDLHVRVTRIEQHLDLPPLTAE